MKTGHRIGLIFGASVLGAAGISYFVHKRRGKELMTDTLLNGLVAGTAFNVVGFLIVDGVQVPLLTAAEPVRPVSALTNGTVYAQETAETAKLNSAVASGGMGKTPKQALEILEKIDQDRLYAHMNENGVKVGPVPDNASMISQEE